MTVWVSPDLSQGFGKDCCSREVGKIYPLPYYIALISFQILPSLKQGNPGGCSDASSAESYGPCVSYQSHTCLCVHTSVLSYMHCWHLYWIEVLKHCGMITWWFSTETKRQHILRKRPKFLSVKQLGEKEGSELNTFFRTTTNLFHLYFAFYVYINSKIERKKPVCKYSYAENFKWRQSIES